MTTITHKGKGYDIAATDETEMEGATQMVAQNASAGFMSNRSLPLRQIQILAAVLTVLHTKAAIAVALPQFATGNAPMMNIGRAAGKRTIDAKTQTLVQFVCTPDPTGGKTDSRCQTGTVWVIRVPKK
jgi:deoxyxylulose-5-phosphate synthase